MKNLVVQDVNQALRQGLQYLLHNGLEEESRVGPVLAAPCPVVTTYTHPLQRVLFHPVRDANPFFHFMESLWMLAGRNDVAFVKHYASRMDEFSDDGKTLHGAYGYRWRKAMGLDQLEVITQELKRNPKSRRCVLQMWDASAAYYDLSGNRQANNNGSGDLHLATHGGKDVPCNTHAYFDTVGGKLNMTVCCRSNDMVWGAYGANAVHFSFLLEYVALAAGLEVGRYRQFSNNFHIYKDRPDVQRLISCYNKSPIDFYYETPYDNHAFVHVPLITGAETIKDFDSDLFTFFYTFDNDGLGPVYEYRTKFFAYVVHNISRAYQIYKMGAPDGAIRATSTIQAADWRVACAEWLKRRIKPKEAT